MPKPKKRDNAYWLPRLKTDHPAIYARVMAGEISVRQGCAEAGLIHLPTRADALMREWRAATAKERREFLSRVKAEATGTVAKPLPPPRAKLLLEPDGKLSAATIARITLAMRRLGVKSGPVCRAMGYNALDPRLGMALNRAWAPHAEYLGRLATWLAGAERTIKRGSA